MGGKKLEKGAFTNIIQELLSYKYSHRFPSTHVHVRKYMFNQYLIYSPFVHVLVLMLSTS